MESKQESLDDLGLIPADDPADDLGAVAVPEDDDIGFVPEEGPFIEPDMGPVKAYFEENLKKPREAKGFIETLEAGWDMSVAGLITQGKPDVVMPENAGMAANIASGIATIAGDLPAIVAGFFAGGAGGAAAGTAVAPGPGTAVGAVIGAGAGANALPAAIRTTLMQHYENGEVKDFTDFWERASAVFIETSKQAVIGGVSAGAGVAIARVVSPIVGATAGRLSATTSEIATMTAVGATLEGQVPKMEDFTAAALMIATIHGIAKVGVGGTKNISQKMRKIYAETGITPDKIVEEAKTNPILQQELLMDNDAVPGAFKTEEAAGAAQNAGPQVTMADLLNEPRPPITPDSLAVRTILEGVEDAPKANNNKPRYSIDKGYTDFVDRLHPINQAVKAMTDNPKNLSVEQNPYQLARMANDSKAKVKHFIERGTIDFKTLAVNGKGMNEIVAPFKGNLREFEAFLISKRALDYESRGMNAGFDLDAAREVIRMGDGKYGSAAKELVEFQKRTLQYAKDSGMISDKSFVAMVKAGENYIPLKRIMEPEQFQNVRKGGVLKRVKGVEEGSDIKTRSPIMSILENTELLMQAAEKNRALESFVRMAEEPGADGVIQKVDAKSRPIKVSEKEVSKFLEEAGIEADAEAFNIFRPNQITLADNEFQVIRDGKREVYRTTPELAEAFRSLDGDKNTMGILMRLARGITTIKRIGITMTPEFITRNFLRDQMMTGATSKGNVIPFVDVVVALGDLVKKNDHYYNWLKAGGAQGAFLELNDRYLMKDVFKLDKSTGMLESAWNIIKTPADAVMAAAHIVELAPRLAEFKKVSGKASSGSAVFEGGFASREVTLDFQRMGAKMSAFNAITAFTNATIQGADKAARSIRDNPKGVLIKGAAYITAPSVLLWWANKDDERYKSVPRWEKDLYWIIPTDKWVAATEDDHADMLPDHLTKVVNGELHINKGTVYRVPKPHEYGLLFGSLPERLLEKYFGENPRAMKGFEETIGHMLSPGIVPDAAAPALEQWANKSFFTGRKMIPFALEKVAPEYQYTDYTSETAKQLSKLTSFLTGPERAIAPIVVDNYVRQWSGTMGQYALGLADKGLAKAGVGNQNKAEDSLADIPAIKAFVVRYPGSGAQQITDFYDREKEIEQKMATIRLLSKQEGMEEELERYIESNSGESMARLTATGKALANSRKLIRSINANPEIPPKEKRQLIDGQYYHMIEAAKSAMEIADQLEKEMDEAGKQVAESR